MVNIFQKLFNWVFQDSSEESVSMAAIALQSVFFKWQDLKLKIIHWSMGCDALLFS